VRADESTKSKISTSTKAQSHPSPKASSRSRERQEVRATRGKGMVSRRDGTAARRVVAYLPADLGKQLVVYCAEQGHDLSAAIEAAVRQFLGGVRAPGKRDGRRGA
jgi:hypothetical protein